MQILLRTSSRICLSGIIFIVCAIYSYCGEQAAIPSIDQITFVVFDIETTGFSPDQDRIVELAALKFKGTNDIATMSCLVNPGIRIPVSASRIHGIDNAMVINQPKSAKALSDFFVFANGSVLLAHNARFDVKFVEVEARRNGIKLPDMVILDTLSLSRKWFPGLKSYSLLNLIKHLRIGDTQIHRALSDAQLTRLVFMQGLRTMDNTATLDNLVMLAGKSIRFDGN
ncbi:MAG: 3'-5' exonuclease [Lentisphaerae bacterium]|nr:3'-5' exonuclease [Lentisphaerota bacterium]